MSNQRILWTQWGEHARSILRQYAEARYLGHRFWGPHYVIYERGNYYLRPFGFGANWRYVFECRPFLPGEAEPMWTFVVM